MFSGNEWVILILFLLALAGLVAGIGAVVYFAARAGSRRRDP